MERPAYDGEIRLPPKASTRTRLHELAHRELGHEPGRYTIEELARNEVAAEAFAWERMGKELNHRVGLPAVGALLEYAPGLGVSRTLNIVSDALREVGVTVTSTGREDLRRFIEEHAWL